MDSRLTSATLVPRARPAEEMELHSILMLDLLHNIHAGINVDPSPHPDRSDMLTSRVQASNPLPKPDDFQAHQWDKGHAFWEQTASLIGR